MTENNNTAIREAAPTRIKPGRKPELSLMNVILCGFVIFIHSVSSAVSTADKASWQYAVLLFFWRGAACAVPGFFFLSGLKLSLGLDKPFSYPKYLLGRAKRVLLPYLLACVVYYAFFVGHNYMGFDIGLFVHETVFGNFGGHLYFVVTVVQFYITAPLWRLLAKKLDSPARIAVALIAAYFISQIFGQYSADYLFIFNKESTFIYADRILTTYLFWWMLGLVVGRHYEQAVSSAKRDFIPAAVLFGFALINASFLNHLHFTGRERIWWLESAHTFFVFTAIIFLFALSVKLGQTRLYELTKPIDHASYQIYLWHVLFIFVADIVCVNLGLGSIFAALIVRLGFGLMPILLAYVFKLLAGLKKKK